MIHQGRIVAVQIERLGSELTTALTGGETSIAVASTDDFHEDGGQVSFTTGAEVDTYDAVDDDALTLSIPGGVTNAYAVGDRVDVFPIAERVWAYVQIGAEDDDPVIAEVPYSLRALVPTGVREEDDVLSAVIEDRGGAWVVTDITGPRQPSLEVDEIVATTLVRSLYDLQAEGFSVVSRDGTVAGISVGYNYPIIGIKTFPSDPVGAGIGFTTDSGVLFAYEDVAGSHFARPYWADEDGFLMLLGRGKTLSPSALTGNRNDYDPGIGAADTFRIDPNGASRTITGIVEGRPGEYITLLNIGSTAGETLIFSHQDAASTAVNRIICPGFVNLTVDRGGGVQFYYDDTTNRWRAVRAS